MKKIKWTIMTFVISAGICSAFATRPHALNTTLYYYNGRQYLPAGIEGVNYVCVTSTQICTYILSGATYVPYEVQASYFPISLESPAETAQRTEK